MIDSLELKAEVGGFVTIATQFKSLKSADASLTPSFASDYSLLGKHVKFKLASSLS